MRNHVVEQALLNLLEYLDEAQTTRDKCAIVKEFWISAELRPELCRYRSSYGMRGAGGKHIGYVIRKATDRKETVTLVATGTQVFSNKNRQRFD